MNFEELPMNRLATLRRLFLLFFLRLFLVFSSDILFEQLFPGSVTAQHFKALQTAVSQSDQVLLELRQLSVGLR